VKEVDEQIPGDAATQYRTVGGSQWMLALNYIWKDAMLSTQIWESNNGPNLSGGIHSKACCD
jgi:hypothetical protein